MKPFALAPLRLTLLCLLLSLLAACSKTYSWNQKLTVTVMTPAGEVSASSVVEIILTDTGRKFVPPEARGVKSKLSGEAVVLEVSPSKYLFVLLGGVDRLALTAFPQFSYESSSEFGRWARQIEKHRGSGTVPREKYPMMVTFEDTEDPRQSVRWTPTTWPQVSEGAWNLKTLCSISQTSQRHAALSSAFCLGGQPSVQVRAIV